MKTKILYFAFAILLISSFPGMAQRPQHPLHLSVAPSPPFSARVGEYIDDPSRFCQVVVSNNGAGSYDFFITMKLQMLFPGDVSAEAPADRPPGIPVKIGPYQTIVLNRMHYDQLLGHLKSDDLITNGIQTDAYFDGTLNLLPEGTYQICFTALDFNASFGMVEPLSDPLGGCVTFNICYAASAPVLVNPSPCAMNLPEDEIQPVSPFIISWIPPSFNCAGAIANFNYSLKMVEVMPGQDLQEAIDFNPEALRIDNIMTASLQIDTLMYPGVFRQGERYVIQVTASDMMQTGNVTIANNGAGPICSFIWGSPLPEEEPGAAETPDDEPEVPELPDEPDQPFVTPLVDHDTSDSTDPACLAELPSNRTPFEGVLAGKQIRIGHFMMHVVTASLAGDVWTGTGTIVWSPLGAPLRVRVEFNNIRVNSELRVFEGEVLSQQQTALNDYVPLEIQQAIDFSDAVLNYPSQFGVNVPATYRQRMEGYYNFIRTQAQTIQQLTGDFNLPVRIESIVPGTNIDIGIIGMRFTPTTAKMNTMAVFRVPEALPSSAQWLAFVGQGMCFTPNILVSPNEANLFLAADFDLDVGGGFNMIFRRATTLGNISDGTFIKWTNSGFDEGRIALDVRLPNVLVGELPDGRPDRNSRVTASFSTWFSDWNDWIATATIPTFQVSGLPGFGFSASQIVYDHSATQNPNGLAFPPDPDTGVEYGALGSTWQGFFMDQLQVQLPPDFNSGADRGFFSLNQLIIDDFGVTFNVLAQNVLQTGVLGGCAFSIDTIRTNLYKSDFRLAQIRGGITLPVAQDPLRYEGLLKTTESDINELDYSFYVKPASDIAMPIWLATLNIGDASALEIFKDNHGAAVKFLLHGNISLNSNPSINPMKFNMPGLKFQNFGIANRKSDNTPGFFMSEGNWSQTSAQKSLGPFDVNIDVPMPYFAGGEFGLKIKTDFSIGEGAMKAFTCETTLDVVGRLNWNPAQNMLPTGVGLETIRLDEIIITGDFGPVDIDGKLKFYYDDPTFGDGLRGEVNAVFDPLITIKSVAQFGKTSGSDGFTYWYVDAMANFSPTIPLFSPIAMGGFGGGVYYNMKRQTEPPLAFSPDEAVPPVIPDLNNPTLTASGVTLLPENGSIGFKAGVTLALHEAANAFNGSLWLECEFRNGRFNNISFNGDAYILTNYPANDSYMAKANVHISYSKPEHFLKFTTDVDANFFGIGLRMPIRFESLTDQGKWFLMMGDPHGERIKATLININAGILKAKLTSENYFALGNNLPNTNLPAPPQKIVQFLNLTNLDQNRATIHSIPTKGMLFGAKIDGTLDIDLVIYCHLEAIAGFDVSLLHYENATCNNKPMGLYGWYGLGQVYGYFHGDVGIKINVWFFKGKASLCQLTAGAFLRGGMPTPFWAYGKARVKGSVLGGMIKISTSVELDIGEKCLPPVGDPLAAIKVLEDIQPGYKTFDESQQAEPESVFSIPRVTANLELSNDQMTYPFRIEIPPSSENQYGEVREYKFTIEHVRLITNVAKDLADYPAGGGQNIPFKIGEGVNSTQVVINYEEGFRPLTNYALRVVARAWQRLYDADNQTQWQNPFIDGVQKSRTEVLDTYFRTGELPRNIADRLLMSYPVNRQRYFYRDEDFTLVTHGQMQYLWNDRADEEVIRAYVSRVRGNPENPFETQRLVSFHWLNNRTISYLNTIKHLLQPEEIYAFSIVRINLAKESEYLEKMAKEQRRLIVKNLMSNQLTTAIIQAGQITAADMGEVTLAQVPTEDIMMAGPLQSVQTNVPGQSSETATNQSQPRPDGGALSFTNPGLSELSNMEFQNQAGMQQHVQVMSNLASMAEGNTTLNQAVVQSGSQTVGIQSNTPNSQQGLSVGIPQNLAISSVFGLSQSEPGVLLEMLTLEEYNQHFKADTIDIREQVLEGKFEKEYMDTLFSVTFATSRYRSLQDKLNAYGAMFITGLYENAESISTNEPFEQIELIGFDAHYDNIYLEPFPPLLRFYLPYNSSHPRDRYWFDKFDKLAHDLQRLCGPPNSNPWKPRNDVPVVPYPHQLEVSYGSTTHHRESGYFPLPNPTGNEHFPGRNHPMIFHGSQLNMNDMAWELSRYEMSNNQYASLNISSSRKLIYNHRMPRGLIYDDIGAMKLFTDKFREIATAFQPPASGTTRKNRTNDWISNDEWIVVNKGQTQIKMPKYQISYFFTLKVNGDLGNQRVPVDPTPWNIGQEQLVSDNGNWRNKPTELRVQFLDIKQSLWLQPGQAQWQYMSPPNLKMNVVENMPVYH